MPSRSKSTWCKSTKAILPSLWRISKYITLDGLGGIYSPGSVIIPDTSNCLFNPSHPDAANITVHQHSFSMDKRLQQLVDYAFSYREEVHFVSRDS